MTVQEVAPGLWARLPVTLRAIVVGLAVALTAANVWPLLEYRISGLRAAGAELAFLGFYIWWTWGGGWPRATAPARRNGARARRLSAAQWAWGLIAALFFAATVHAATYLLFRFVPFPLQDFRQGYDFSFIPTVPLRWLAVVISAMSAGVCEETGFRGYMQRPMEQRHGAALAIVISAVIFTLLHLNKGWATIGMVPIVLGAGLLLGALAWAARSLVPGMIGHTIMDIGFFGFWWTGVAGDFTERPIYVTGLDLHFEIGAGVFLVAVTITLLAIVRLSRMPTP